MAFNMSFQHNVLNPVQLDKNDKDRKSEKSTLRSITKKVIELTTLTFLPKNTFFQNRFNKIRDFNFLVIFFLSIKHVQGNKFP